MWHSKVIVQCTKITLTRISGSLSSFLLTACLLDFSISFPTWTIFYYQNTINMITDPCIKIIWENWSSHKFQWSLNRFLSRVAKFCHNWIRTNYYKNNHYKEPKRKTLVKRYQGRSLPREVWKQPKGQSNTKIIW